MSEYTSAVAPTTSHRRKLQPKSQNLPTDVGSRFVRACIPEPIHTEIAASNLRELEKLIVYSIVWECATTNRGCKHISTDLLNNMPGILDRGRARIKRYLKASPHFGFYRHEKFTTCEAFFVSGFVLAERSLSCNPVQPGSQSGSAQHTSDVQLGVWCGDVVYRMVDLGLVDELVRVAKEALEWDIAEKKAKKAIEAIELVGVPESDAELFDAAMANIPLKLGRNKINAAKKLAKAHEKAKKQVASIRLFQRDPTAAIQRKAGRLYTRLSSFPRWARRQFVRFIGGQQPDTADVRCCYLWCVAARLRQKRMKRGLDISSVNRLLDLIESGGFYEEIAKRAGKKTSQAKKSFAVLCLFGDRKKDHWGCNSLWFALDAICPEVCDEIVRWRSHTNGQTRFAEYCQKLEGSIMLNGLAPAMAELDIRCAIIHDGCLVPPGCGGIAAQAIRDRAASIFGRPCFVSQTTN